MTSVDSWGGGKGGHEAGNPFSSWGSDPPRC